MFRLPFLFHCILLGNPCMAEILNLTGNMKNYYIITLLQDPCNNVVLFFNSLVFIESVRH